MSPTNELSPEALDHINVEIIDHLKRSGIYDEIRMGLMDQIWSDSCFQQDIVVRFISECEKFCEQVDLSSNRNTLRSKLQKKFELGYSTSGRLVRSHIETILNQRSEDVKSKYHQHARAFITKFLPSLEPLESEPKSETQAVIDMEIETDEEEIERPEYSPIGNDDVLLNTMKMSPSENSPQKTPEENPNNTTRKSTRARKSNPRYSNEDFKLL